MSTYVKYEEGFLDYNGTIVTKPFQYRIPKNQEFMTVNHIRHKTP
jgi:hypothetical protein